MPRYADESIRVFNTSMALTLDTSRPLRSVRELEDIVQAILLSPLTESEPDWLEWKREADLSERHWQARIAKFIAGVANRDPKVAMREFGGCAYLVIGVEPGIAIGISPIDNAILHAGVVRFVHSGVRWNPQYVQHQGKHVLIITVEPPEYGDEIVAMLAGLQSQAGNVCRKGAVYIRSHGKTDHATQDALNMLVKRFAAGPQQADGMTVRAASEVTAIPVASGAGEVEHWISRRRAELLAPIGTTLSSKFRPWGEGRSVREYRAEVASYLSEVTPLLRRKARADALVHRAPNLMLVLVNETEHNFEAARVMASIDGKVWAYDGVDGAHPHMPDVPRAWGDLSMNLSLPASFFSDVVTQGTGLFGPDIKNDGSTQIEFGDIDLRPRDKVNLDPIHLVADPALAGATLKLVWTVTSTSSSGVVRGEIPVTVSSEVVSPLTGWT